MISGLILLLCLYYVFYLLTCELDLHCLALHINDISSTLAKDLKVSLSLTKFYTDFFLHLTSSHLPYKSRQPNHRGDVSPVLFLRALTLGNLSLYIVSLFLCDLSLFRSFLQGYTLGLLLSRTWESPL